MQKVFSFLDRMLYGFNSLLLLAIVLLLFANILLRYAFQMPIAWTEELSMLFLVWMVYGAATTLQKKGKHLAVEIVYNKMPLGVKRWMDIVGLSLTLIALAFLVVAAFKLVRMQYHSYTMTLYIRYSYFSLPVLLGSILMLIHTATALGRKIWGSSEK